MNVRAKLALFTCILFMPFVKAENWENCIGNQVCTPSEYYEPKTVEELQSCLKNAVSHGKKVRVLGSGYSLSGLVCTEGALLNLKNFNRILSVDRRAKLVRIEAGITLKTLNDQLAQQGLALPNQPAIDTITLGGALATAVHGTGHTGTLSSFVKAIELMTADGNMHHLSSSSNPEAFAAAKVGLGALGVTYAATLQCEPLFYLKTEREVLDIDSAVARYKELHRNNDFFQFTWDIANEKALVTFWNRSAQGEVCYKALTYHTIDESDKDLFSEIAIPIDRLPEVVSQLKKFVKKQQCQGVQVADIVVRFVETDKDSYLSPAGYSVAYITMSIPRENGSLSFYEEFEELMIKYQGRPHWGKVNFMDYRKAKLLYGANLEKFIRVKQRLDPQGVFSNANIHRLCEPK